MRLAALALVLVPCTAAELVDVRSARHADFTRIVFETDEKVSYAIENRSLGSERAIELTLPAVAREMVLRAVHEPAVSVQVQTHDAGSRALVRVNGPVDVWTNQLGNPPRVVLDLRVAEPVADRDPEQLDALDYQILVEADPGAPPNGAPEPGTPEPAPASPDPPGVSTPPAATAGPGSESVAPRDAPPAPRPPGWASSTRLWWALLAVALLFIAVLWGQRIAQRRRREERAGPAPATPRPRAARPLPPQVTRVPPTPVTAERPGPASPPASAPQPSAAPGPASKPPRSSDMPPVPAPEPAAPEREVEAASPPTAPPAPASSPEEERGARPPQPGPAPSPHAAAPPDAARSPGARGGSEPVSELFELLGRMEERLAVIERELRETRAEERALRERSIAQSEELRAQRVAVARLLRRPRSVPSTHTPRRSPSSS